MNLAEIRKKAVETKKTEVREPLAASGGFDVDDARELDTFGSDAYEFPEDEYFPATEATEGESGDFTLFEPESSGHELLQTGGDAGADELTLEEVDVPAGEPAPERGPERGPEAPCPVSDPVDSVPPVTAIRHPAYDPVATLLAGRQAAASGGDEVACGDEPLGVSGDVEEYLCFKVAHEEYALSIMDIKEIIKPREVTEVPRMPKFIPGVISLRGVITPIMDIRLRLSLPVGEQTGRERVLVLRTSTGYCGVLVDEVIQVVRLQQGDIEGPPTVLDGIDREFVIGLGRYEQRMLILLNLDSILNLEIH